MVSFTEDRNMASVKAYLKISCNEIDGVYPLVLEVAHKGEKSRVKTAHKLLKEELDEIRVKEEILEMNYAISCMEDCVTDFSVSDIVSLYQTNRERLLIKPYMEKMIDARKQERKGSEAEFYEAVLKKMLLFHQEKGPLTFNDMDAHWLQRLRDFLLASGMSEKVIRSYWRVLTCLYRNAQRDGLCSEAHNPFMDTSFVPVREIKLLLNEEEQQRLATIDLSDDSQLSLARDLYLFANHAGSLSLMDMISLKRSTIYKDKIWYRRGSNNKLSFISIDDVMHGIIRKYENEGEKIFPQFHKSSADWHEQYCVGLRCYNGQLKKIAQLLNLSVAYVENI